MSEIRTIIDTGVAVSALLLPRSVPRQAFDAAGITKDRIVLAFKSPRSRVHTDFAVA